MKTPRSTPQGVMNPKFHWRGFGLKRELVDPLGQQVGYNLTSLCFRVDWPSKTYGEDTLPDIYFMR